MPQEVKSIAPLSPADRPTLQGLVATHAEEKALLAALEQAFDYRGDVTLTLDDGAVITGYIFDRRTGPTLADSSLRLMTPDTGEKLRFTYDRIVRLEFTGKDTAHGKTFDNWLKRYVEKKLAGETASIDSEKLD